MGKWAHLIYLPLERISVEEVSGDIHMDWESVLYSSTLSKRSAKLEKRTNMKIRPFNTQNPEHVNRECSMGIEINHWKKTVAADLCATGSESATVGVCTHRRPIRTSAKEKGNVFSTYGQVVFVGRAFNRPSLCRVESRRLPELASFSPWDVPTYSAWVYSNHRQA